MTDPSRSRWLDIHRPRTSESLAGEATADSSGTETATDGENPSDGVDATRRPSETAVDPPSPDT